MWLTHIPATEGDSDLWELSQSCRAYSVCRTHAGGATSCTTAAPASCLLQEPRSLPEQLEHGNGELPDKMLFPNSPRESMSHPRSVKAKFEDLYDTRQTCLMDPFFGSSQNSRLGRAAVNATPVLDRMKLQGQGSPPPLLLPLFPKPAAHYRRKQGLQEGRGSP